jgi:hypothetical protein
MVTILTTTLLLGGCGEDRSRESTQASGSADTQQAEAGKVLFSDDFEGELEGWQISNAQAIAVSDTGEPGHGRVLKMAPAGAKLHALIRGSERWGRYRIEGEVLFPTDEHNYLGFIYNYREREGRVDLGSIYIKGNGSYIRVNPRRDWNPSRALYEEYRVPLEGDDAIRTGEWQRFAAEVVGRVCHFYVGDMRTPKVTFDFYEYDSGQAGFKPRVVGGPVWIDNLRVRGIAGLSYQGPRLPAGIEYRPQDLVTDWQVLGPLTRAFPEIEALPDPTSVPVSDEGETRQWRRFETDPRGAVLTGRVVDFLGSRTIAYFATTIHVGEDEGAALDLSSVDDFALWHDGVFEGYGYREFFAWHDFGRNPDHPASEYPLPLHAGVNHVMFRVRGGVYASGGFFVRVFRESTGAGTGAAAR